MHFLFVFALATHKFSGRTRIGLLCNHVCAHTLTHTNTVTRIGNARRGGISNCHADKLTTLAHKKRARKESRKGERKRKRDSKERVQRRQSENKACECVKGWEAKQSENKL